MSARTRPDGDRTRERILEVALPLFAEHGYAGTSVRAVANAAAVNVATLAYHFVDKEGLYETVVQRLHVELSSHFPTEGPLGRPEEVMGWWMRAAWNFAQEHRQHLRLLVRHLLDHGSQPQIVMDQWSEALLVRAEAIVAAFQLTAPQAPLGQAIPLTAPQAPLGQAIPLTAPQAPLGQAIPLTAPQAPLGQAIPLTAPQAPLGQAIRPEWPPHRRRLLVLSLMHLTVRLVLEDPGQLAKMSGIPVERIEDEVVDWLTSLALREMGRAS